VEKQLPSGRCGSWSVHLRSQPLLSMPYSLLAPRVSSLCGNSIGGLYGPRTHACLWPACPTLPHSTAPSHLGPLPAHILPVMRERPILSLMLKLA